MGRHDKALRFRLTPRDREILREVCLSRAIDRDGLMMLLGFGSIGRLNARMNCLVRGKFVRRVAFPNGPSAVRSVYLLGPASIDLLTSELDLDRSEIARVARQEPARAYVEHSLLVVELRLAIEAGARAHGFAVEEFFHEASCRHEYVASKAGKKVRVIVKPDALVILTKGGQRWHVFIEGDRGTRSASNELASFKRYAAYSQGVFRIAYGAETDHFHVCLISTAGDRRVSHLTRLTKGLDGPTFHFTTLARLSLGGFFAPIWERYGTERPEGPLSFQEKRL